MSDIERKSSKTEVLKSAVIACEDKIKRCFWCASDDLYRAYHDDEWGHPLTNDRQIFEKLCLEGFQAGLSWLTILRKREAFRKAFADFDFHKVAKFSTAKVDSLVQNAGIIRHRGKIESAIQNAQCALKLIDECGSIQKFVWQFRPEKHKHVRSMSDIVAATPESTAMSKAFRKRGWTFLGPTTCYAFMQSAGLVNDHFTACDAFKKVEKLQQSISC